MDSKLIVALELGDYQLGIMEGMLYEDHTLQILGATNVKTPHKAINNGWIGNTKLDDLALEINGLIKKLDNIVSNSNKIDKYYVSFQGRGLMSKAVKHTKAFSEETIINQDILKKMIEETVEQHTQDNTIVYGYQTNNYSVDGELIEKSPIGMNCKSIIGNYLIYTGRKEMIQNFPHLIDRLHGNVQKEHIVGPVNTAKYLLTDEEKRIGTACIDFGAGSTHLVIYKDNLVKHFATIPFGGNDVTNDMTEFNLSFDIADHLKQQKGGLEEENKHKAYSLPEGQNSNKSIRILRLDIVNQIKARIDEIIHFIMQECQQNEFPLNSLPGGIVITGGASLLKDLPSYLTQMTQANVRIGSMKSHIHSGTENIEKYDTPQNANLISLLLAGKENCTKDINKSSRGDKNGNMFSKLKSNVVNGLGHLFDTNEQEENI